MLSMWIGVHSCEFDVEDYDNIKDIKVHNLGKWCRVISRLWIIIIGSMSDAQICCGGCGGRQPGRQHKGGESFRAGEPRNGAFRTRSSTGKKWVTSWYFMSPHFDMLCNMLVIVVVHFQFDFKPETNGWSSGSRQEFYHPNWDVTAVRLDYWRRCHVKWSVFEEQALEIDFASLMIIDTIMRKQHKAIYRHI